MQNLFKEAPFREVLARLEKIDASSNPQWGKMNAPQMMNHCQKPLLIALGKTDFGLKKNLLARWFFKKQMYNDRPWPKGMKTPESFKVEEQKDFSEEKDRLTGLIQELYALRDQEHWPEHPVFGRFTKEQLGKMQFKHLDHHLRQFGV